MTAYFDAVRKTEENLINAWPALRTVFCNGWVFRDANGYTKRANSASVLERRGSFVPTLVEAERFYASLGAPTIFRLTPLAGAETDRILADCGYSVVDETIVMTAPHASGEAADGGVSVATVCTSPWEKGYSEAHDLSVCERSAHRAILSKIAPLKTAFAVAYDEDRAAAFGLGVVERDRLGIFDIVTAPSQRRKGLARKLVSALMAWGLAEEAESAWLSVIAGNENAKALYSQLGFHEEYRYHYRVNAQQDG